MFFNKETYISKRLELIKKVGKGIIVLPGNGESARNFKANTYFFVQDSSFLYYTGIKQPDLILVINCDSGDSILFGDEFSLEHSIWMGAQESLQSKASKIGIDNVLELKKLTHYIEKNSSKSQIHYLPPYRSETTIFLSQLLDKSIQEINLNASIILIKSIISQREIKSEAEINELDKALAITKEMHLKVMSTVSAGKSESHLVGNLKSAAIKKGSYTAYPPIVSVQGQILHNFIYKNELKNGQLLLGDFAGMSQSGYAADITRTIPVSGKFTNKQKEIYQIVLDAQKSAIKMLKPNVLFKDVHLNSCKTIIEGLKNIGLMKGDTEEAVAKGAHTLFFPHGLGHMIGLDVHDMENLGEEYVGYDNGVSKSTQFGLKSLRLGKRLKQGFTITIEPGIYFIPELIQEWKSNNKACEPFLNFDKIASYSDFGGIRIEDEYLVTEKNSRILGEYIPKEISELEQIIAN